jgi:hypothetical protein
VQKKHGATEKFKEVTTGQKKLLRIHPQLGDIRLSAREPKKENWLEIQHERAPSKAAHLKLFFFVVASARGFWRCLKRCDQSGVNHTLDVFRREIVDGGHGMRLLSPTIAGTASFAGAHCPSTSVRIEWPIEQLARARMVDLACRVPAGHQCKMIKGATHNILNQH